MLRHSLRRTGKPAPHATLGASRSKQALRAFGRHLATEMLEDRRLLTLTTSDLTTGLTPADLAQTLVGPGISISNVTFTGSQRAAGKFFGGTSEGLGVNTGVLLSSGDIADAAGPNNSDQVSTGFNLPGDTDLSGLINGTETNDAAVLEFDFEATGGTLSFQYVFGSDEYNEFVGSFNDVFGFFLNGQNVALIPQTSTPVSINNVNKLVNSAFYRNNDPSDFATTTPFPTQADGFTAVFQAAAPVSVGKNHIKLAIADAVDFALDSWVFLTAESFVSGSADVGITQTDSPDSVPAGDTLTYSLVVTNHGPENATAVLVQDTLPANVTFVGATISAGSVFQAGGIVTATPPKLAPGESVNITITVIPTVPSIITNTATVQAAQVDSVPGNNVSIESTTVVRFKVAPLVQREGNSGLTDFIIAVTQQSGSTDTKVMAYDTADASALAGLDYLPTSGSLTYAPGETQKFITVQVIGDAHVEADEQFIVAINDATDIGLDRTQAAITIVNDDSALTINDAPAVYEGDSNTRYAVFTVSVTGAIHISPITVSYYTLDGSAVAGTDFQPRSGVLTFAPGTFSLPVSVPIIGDVFNESPETFTLNLINPFNAEFVRDTGIGTILDDDPTPSLYVNDVNVTTTEAGLLNAVFTVALNRPSGQNVSVNFATSDNTAINGVDYAGLNGGLVFAPGITTLSVTVPILTSSQYSANKTFQINLFGALNANLGDPLGIGSIIYAAPPVNEFIIDNGDPLYSRSGGWTSLTNTLAYNLDYDYHAAGNGSGKATWSFFNIPAGNYQVLAKWIPFSNRATNAPFTISDNQTALGTVLVNQQLFPTGDQSNGITWQSLGTYHTSSGILNVRLGDNANGYVIADAIRLVRDGIAVQVPEMDVAAFNHSVSTGDATPAADDGTDFGIVASLSNSVSHTFTISNNGNAPLHLTGSPRVQISGANPEDFSVVVQPAASVAAGFGTNFEILFHPSAEGLRQAVISIANDDDSEHPYTFTVQGTGAPAGPNERIIDDLSSGFLKNGAWADNNNAYGYGGQVKTVAAGTGGDWARWTFGGLAPGLYDVYATWVAFGNRATNAPFTIADGSISSFTTIVNQQQWPATPLNGINWKVIGSIDVTSGTLTVRLNNAANGYVVADAIMVARHDAPQPAAPLAHNAIMPLDVNGDHNVSSIDALLVINSLLTSSAAPQATPLVSTLTASPGYYRDVNGDGHITPRDALLVISHLLSPQAAPAAAAPTAAPAAAQPLLESDATIDAPGLAAIDAALSQLSDVSPTVDLPPARAADVVGLAAAAPAPAASVDASGRWALQSVFASTAEEGEEDEESLWSVAAMD